MISADCHYGDHRWLTNGRCAECGAFNGGWLQWQRIEKAIRDGRSHYGHFHLTAEAKTKCQRQPDADWIEAYGTSEVPQ